MTAPRPEVRRTYTPGEVAEMFNVDPKTVARWHKAGKVTAIRTPGNVRRYDADQIDALLRGES